MKRSLLLKSICLMGSFFFVSCVSNPRRDLQRIHSGMDKSMVLDAAGSPQQTYRRNGKDHWIYTFFVNDQQYLRDISFKEGRVNEISEPYIRGHRDDDNLRGADTLEEFEQRGRRIQKKNNSGFQEIKGGN